MSGDGADHYRVLEVARSASPDEVKSAYRRLVRVHRPEDDPDGFARIAAAYRVLGDPELRREYDAAERLPPHVALALDEATALIEKRPDAAAAAAQKVRDANPDSTLVAFAAASICLRAQRAGMALPIVQRLVQENPGRADFRTMLGDTFAACKRPVDAARELAAALAMDPGNVGACLSLAAVHDNEDRPEAALRVVDAGIAAGGVADLARLPLHFRKFCLLARDGRWTQMQKVVNVIQSSVPPGDADAARHVASRLAGLAEQYVELHVPDVGRVLVVAAYGIDPHPALKARSEELAGAAAKARACRDAFADAEVADWIKALLAPHFGRRVPDSIWARNWRATVSLVHAKRRRCESQWGAFSAGHPAAAAVIGHDWKTLRAQSREARSTSNPAPSGSFARLGIVGALALVFVIRALFSESAPPRQTPSWDYSNYRVPSYVPSDRNPGETNAEYLERKLQGADPEALERMTDLSKPYDFRPKKKPQPKPAAPEQPDAPK